MFTACKENVQTILDEYNSHFTALSPEDYLHNQKPGDEGFDASFMIKENLINVSYNSTFSISAPAECEGYIWELYENKLVEKLWPDGFYHKEPELRKINLPNYISTDKSIFYFYIPDVRELTYGTYKLKLFVKDKMGNYHTDSCTLVIHESVYF